MRPARGSRAAACALRPGGELLARFMARTEDRDAPTSVALRDAQYDAIVEWGIADHGALQRLTAIGCRR